MMKFKYTNEEVMDKFSFFPFFTLKITPAPNPFLVSFELQNVSFDTSFC